MQKLVSETISQGRDAADPAAMDAQAHAYRSAALIGASQTAARSGALMRKYHALARRLFGRQDDYLRFTRDFRVSPDNNEAVMRSPVRVHSASVSRPRRVPRKQCLTGGGSA